MRVYRRDNLDEQENWLANRDLARDMLKHVEEFLKSFNVGLRDISGIGIFRGPGSYTGLRIGMTVLNTIASELNIPIVGEVGENWQDRCLERLVNGENDKIILPEYGGDAKITKPNK